MRGAVLMGLALTFSPGLVLSARAAPSTTVTVSGQVGTPRTLSLTDLQALAQSTKTETYISAGKSSTDTFTGPSLWNVLTAAGGITTSNAKNDLLQTYVIATGTDGYTSVISAGEIAPNFGNKTDLVAIQDTNSTLPGSAGVARVTASGDIQGGRYVSNLASLVVAHGPTIAGTGGGVSSSITVQGNVTTTLNLTLSGLEALTAHTETMTYTSAGKSVTDTYTGVLLWDVLSQAGIAIDPTIKNDILRQLIVATGSDGYSVDFSAGELSPSFGDEQILVAYSDTAGQLGENGTSGLFRIVVPGDTAGGRYVSNLTSLTVFDATAVPEPAGLAVLAAAGLAMLAARRRAYGQP